MASTSAKRSADSEQSQDSFAVCTNCSHLSNDLANCDRCGTALSPDNASHCYSVDPKRPRVDNNTPPPNGVNGKADNRQDSSTPPTSSSATETTAPSSSTTTTANDSATTTTVSSSQSENTPNGTTSSPSPSTPPTSSATEPVRPAELFANVNNIANRKTNTTTTTSTTSSVDTSANSIPANLTVNAQSAPAPPPYPGIATPAAAPARSSTAPGPPPPLQQSGPRVSLPSYNLQPAAPAAATPSSAPQYAGANKTGGVAPTAGPRIPEPPGLTNQASSSSGHAVSISRDNVLIPAQQIRIGSQKFKPLSPVTFKDDGILFTLKDYTFAPVLLNARAIIKCRANLNFKEFPVFMLQLESSCMRQIRNIFGLKDDEFNENFSGPFEVKRCITIFPTIANSTYSPTEITNALNQVFNTMENRYRRYSKMCEEITPEEAIDILMAPVAMRNPSSTPAAPRPAPPVQAPQPRSHPQQRAMPQVQPQPMHWPTPGMQPNSVGRVPPPQPPVPQPGSAMVRPEGTLTIPADPARWEQMQRSLQVGGVYHVQMNNGQKKYCLWNGTQLVPCFVQNTEVQLECNRVRIGSLKATCNGPVRIKLDNNCGMFFSVTAPGLGNKQLQISTDDILSAYSCFESMARLFITLKWSGGEKVRNTLRMSRKDPTYDPNAQEERRKHMIFTLHNLNPDQKDALVQMRLPGQQRAFFESMSLMKALKILADIQKNSSVQSTLDRYMNGKEAVPNRMKLIQIANQVEQELQKDDVTPEAMDDDDDDDVIMTEEEVGIKCPYTQQVMKEPIRNKVCGHNYEKVAIQEFMSRKKGVAKCPYAGCGNRAPLKPEDMEENPELRAYIKKNT